MTDAVRNRLVLLLLAAATASVLLVPLALRGDGAGTPMPLADPTPAEPSNPPTEPVPDMVVMDRQQADVDGDGQPDEVRLLADPSHGEGEFPEGSVEVVLDLRTPDPPRHCA